MSKEIAAKQSQELSTEVINDWGSEAVQQRNIVIAKILAQQGLSKPVTEGVAKICDLCDSVTGKVVSEFDNKTQSLKDDFIFIPFHCDDLWICEKEVHGKMTYVKSEKVTSQNEGREWNQIIEGIKWKFTRSLYFYCILPSDPTMPVIIPFKSTSLRGGKVLYTFMYVRNQVNINGKVIVIPPLQAFKLVVKKESNDKGVYSVISAEPVRKSTMEELKLCKQWKDILASGSVTADESDIAAAPIATEETPF